LQELNRTRGILGSTLSGAGPSVLIFLDPESSVQQTGKRVREHLRRQGLNPELIQTKITARS
jgi:homoserine kinase